MPPQRNAAMVGPMYELTIETVFSAAHAIDLPGGRELLHGHDWRVTICLAGEQLDKWGLLVDFHTIEDELHKIVKPFHNHTLNDVPPFDEVNPTAEHVAQHIGQALRKVLPEGVSLAWSRVTEAPGCAAVWKP